MNIEFEVKGIIRMLGLTPEEKAKIICKFANFRKEDVINTINNNRGKTPSDIYEILTNLRKKSDEK